MYLHGDRTFLRRRQRGLDRRTRHFNHIHGGEFAHLLARLDAGQIEQVHNQLPHAVEAHQAAVHRALRGLRIRRRAFLQEPQIAFHGHQRRLELVHQHGQELEADLALLLRQLACLPAQDVVPGRLANGIPQLFRGERLGKEIEGPPLGGADRDIQRGVRRDHDDQRVFMFLIEPIQHIQARHSGQLVVEQDNVELARLHHLQPLLAAFRLLDLQAHVPVAIGQRHPKPVKHTRGTGPHPKLVVYDQHTQGVHGNSLQVLRYHVLLQCCFHRQGILRTSSPRKSVRAQTRGFWWFEKVVVTRRPLARPPPTPRSSWILPAARSGAASP